MIALGFSVVVLAALGAAQDSCPPSNVTTRHVPLDLWKNIHRHVMHLQCKAMTPCHKNPNGSPVEPQTSPPNYTVEVNSTKVAPGEALQVTLAAKNCDEFLAVYVQARSGGTPVGTFLNDSNHTLITSCAGGTNNSANYYSEEPIREATLSWVAPRDVNSVTFNVTFVHQYVEFWVGVNSKEVAIEN